MWALARRPCPAWEEIGVEIDRGLLSPGAASPGGPPRTPSGGPPGGDRGLAAHRQPAGRRVDGQHPACPDPAAMIYRDAVSPAENAEPAARPPRRRLAPDDRRQAPIHSALKLFNTHPYDEVSVDDIAAEARMSPPLVYHSYGGQAGVFISPLRQTGDDVVAALPKARRGHPENRPNARPSPSFPH